MRASEGYANRTVSLDGALLDLEEVQAMNHASDFACFTTYPIALNVRWTGLIRSNGTFKPAWFTIADELQKLRTLP